MKIYLLQTHIYLSYCIHIKFGEVKIEEDAPVKLMKVSLLVPASYPCSHYKGQYKRKPFSMNEKHNIIFMTQIFKTKTGRDGETKGFQRRKTKVSKVFHYNFILYARNENKEETDSPVILVSTPGIIL